MRKLDMEINAANYAYADFHRDIEDLTAEELLAIPSFLLDEWNAEQEGGEKA